MTPLPGSLGTGAIYGWRLDDEKFRATWGTEGSFRVGGRWNSKGTRAIYCALDPATAILEVAVHKTFRVLDTVPHVLTAIEVYDPATVHVVQPADVPNPNWVRPGIPTAGQQAFGDTLLAANLFILIPSAVSTHSWNLMFDATRTKGAYKLILQERFALDPRLHPPPR